MAGLRSLGFCWLHLLLLAIRLEFSSEEETTVAPVLVLLMDGEEGLGEASEHVKKEYERLSFVIPDEVIDIGKSPAPINPPTLNASAISPAKADFDRPVAFVIPEGFLPYSNASSPRNKSEERAPLEVQEHSLAQRQAPKGPSVSRSIARDESDTHSIFAKDRGSRIKGQDRIESDRVAFRIEDDAPLSNERQSASQDFSDKAEAVDHPVAEAARGIASNRVQLAVDALQHVRNATDQINQSKPANDLSTAHKAAASEALVFSVAEPGKAQGLSNADHIAQAEVVAAPPLCAAQCRPPRKCYSTVRTTPSSAACLCPAELTDSDAGECVAAAANDNCRRQDVLDAGHTETNGMPLRFKSVTAESREARFRLSSQGGVDLHVFICTSNATVCFDLVVPSASNPQCIGNNTSEKDNSDLKECKLRLFKHTQGSAAVASEQVLAKPVLDAKAKRTFAQISFKIQLTSSSLTLEANVAPNSVRYEDAIVPLASVVLGVDSVVASAGVLPTAVRYDCKD